jgi:spectinomycin phosphotransferase
MFDRPAVRDEQVTAILRERYALDITGLAFLALGHDSNAWTFRASAGDDEAWFVKIRRHIDPARLGLAGFLRDGGLEAVVAPIATSEGDSSVAIDDLHLIVYPFIDGAVAAETGLTDEQWIEYGRIGAALHATRLPPDLEAALPRERFRSVWSDAIGRLDDAAMAYRGDEAARPELVSFWRTHRDEILHLAQRAEEIGRSLRERLDGRAARMQLVPCHADFHTHNLLVDALGGLRVIDWDEAMLAPRERDLMFVKGSPIGLAPGARELGLFEAGYGPLDIDPVKLAYYHSDWAIQDIASYGEQVLLDDIGPESRAYALRLFLSIFAAGGEAEVANQFDTEVEP